MKPQRKALPRYTIRTGQMNGVAIAVVMCDDRVYCHAESVKRAKRIVAALTMYDATVGPEGVIGIG